jgi:hypothetical protein
VDSATLRPAPHNLAIGHGLFDVAFGSGRHTEGNRPLSASVILRLHGAHVADNFGRGFKVGLGNVLGG